MDTSTLFRRNCRARLACSATLALAALSSACGGVSSAGQPAAPVAVVANSPGSVPAAPMPAGTGTGTVSDPVGAGVPGLPAAAPCAGPTCAAPIGAIAALPDWAGASESDAPGYLLPSTSLVTTAGEAPYPDLRALPTRVLPFQATAFGDMSVFSVASVR